MKTEDARKLRDGAEYHLREMAARTKQLTDAGWAVTINDKTLQIKIKRPVVEEFDTPLPPSVDPIDRVDDHLDELDEGGF